MVDLPDYDNLVKYGKAFKKLRRSVAIAVLLILMGVAYAVYYHNSEISSRDRKVTALTDDLAAARREVSTKSQTINEQNATIQQLKTDLQPAIFEARQRFPNDNERDALRKLLADYERTRKTIRTFALSFEIRAAPQTGMPKPFNSYFHTPSVVPVTIASDRMPEKPIALSTTDTVGTPDGERSVRFNYSVTAKAGFPVGSPIDMLTNYHSITFGLPGLEHSKFGKVLTIEDVKITCSINEKSATFPGAGAFQVTAAEPGKMNLQIWKNPDFFDEFTKKP